MAHLALQVGRLLLVNGADTEQAETAVIRLAAVFGCEAHVALSYEALILTVVNGNHFRTKIGRRLPGMNVGMAAIEALKGVADAAASGRLALAEARAALEAVEHAPPVYPRWLVMGALGVTAASLNRLFGGDWASFAVAGVGAPWPLGLAWHWLRTA